MSTTPHQNNINIPNLLTWIRIGLVPLFIVFMYLSVQWLSSYYRDIISVIIFLMAALTDWLDGYLARLLHQQSLFGAFLDPVADKLMVVVALIMLVELHRIHAVIAIIIIGREITISALREWMAKIGSSQYLAVSFLGKIKTIMQMVAIPFLLSPEKLLGINCHLLGKWLMIGATVLTLWSMVFYLRIAIKSQK